MKVLRVGIVIAFVFAFLAAASSSTVVSAAGTAVISQVQAGNASSSRLIEIYNNSDLFIDITDWCVRYVTASTNTIRTCFSSPDITQRLVLPARSYVLIGSSQLGIAADYSMVDGLGTGTVGSVHLVNALGNSVDIFGWGAAASSEGAPKSSDSPTRVYERKLVSAGVYLDENNNSTDFYNSSLRGGDREPYRIQSIIEVTDVCINLDGIQQIVPDGLIADDQYRCVLPPTDVCINIDGVQMVLPSGSEVDSEGNCYFDKCDNLPGFQNDAPAGYTVSDNDGTCLPYHLPIQVTELLPNPDGDDSGNEFIEFYNPNNEMVDMSFHVFFLNGDTSKMYRFKPGTVINSYGYIVIKNSDTIPGFTLTNSSGSLSLQSYDGGQVTDVPAYTNAPSGKSWALIDGMWQFTANASPGERNPTIVVGQGSTGSVSADCGEGRERNPATNRCRNIPSASVLAPCKEGQYRSEETNRCRSIAAAASALKPCADHQFRNPATNRCKNIASSDELADCGEGRERNAVTNRCRNILGATKVPDSAFKVEPIQEGPMAFIGWWALGGIAALAVAYAGWEWRREIVGSCSSIIRRFSDKR